MTPWYVSILVFLELALEAETKCAFMLEIFSFNPCFLGTCPRSKKHIYAAIAGQGVSILVFLELALEGNGGFCPYYRCLSFNPCFLGTCPRSLFYSWSASGKACFNPCFLGTCPRSWIEELGIDGYVMVSILVFLELALEVLLRNWLAFISLSFQSLFSWNLPSKAGK